MGNRAGKHRAVLNLVFRASEAFSFIKKGEPALPMPIFKYFTVVGSALLVFLFVSDAYFNNESNSRFNGSLFESAMYLPRLQETAEVAELRYTRDASPAVRVKEVFAQFVANEARHAKR